MQKVINKFSQKARGSTQRVLPGGFTLIELLVVIAIIGILAGIVLAALGNVRQRGGDAGIAANLANVRTQAEVYAQGNGSSGYTGLCANQNILNAINAAKTDAGVTSGLNSTYATAGSSGTATCHVDGTGSSWAIEVPLKSVNTQFWCVDSNGFSATSTTFSLGTSDTTCNTN
jgi:prepilin-type N-terminal cleavage/methylation domain-containing protein